MIDPIGLFYEINYGNISIVAAKNVQRIPVSGGELRCTQGNIVSPHNSAHWETLWHIVPRRGLS